jgi:hypothetical protein
MGRDGRVGGMSRGRRPLSPVDRLRVDIYRAVQSQATAVAEDRTGLDTAAAEVARVAAGRADLLRELLAGVDRAGAGHPPAEVWRAVIEAALDGVVDG